MNITANGRASNGKGNARVSRINSLNKFLPTKSNRDSAYPAGAPIKIDIVIVNKATVIEFFKAVIIPENSAKKCKLPKSNSGKNDFGKLFTVSGDESVLISRK